MQSLPKLDLNDISAEHISEVNVHCKDLDCRRLPQSSRICRSLDPDSTVSYDDDLDRTWHCMHSIDSRWSTLKKQQQNNVPWLPVKATLLKFMHRETNAFFPHFLYHLISKVTYHTAPHYAGKTRTLITEILTSIKSHVKRISNFRYVSSSYNYSPTSPRHII